MRKITFGHMKEEADGRPWGAGLSGTSVIEEISEG